MYDYTPANGIGLVLGLIAMLFCLDAARRARWSAPVFEHAVWAIATGFVFLGHRMIIALPIGVSLHYLGAALLALLLGYPRAVLSIAAISLLEALEAGALPSWPLRLLLGGIMPVWTMWLIVTGARRWLPRNPFVFLLGCGLFGQFFSYASQLLLSAASLVWLGHANPPALWSEFMPYALLLASGEAWLEGMLVTLLVVYVPGSVRLFDESFYLARPD